MQQVMKKLEIDHAVTTPYHPMSNGAVEAYNGCLKTMLKRMCMKRPKDWHMYIDPALFAYREVPHEATGYSPFELLYGRNVRGPLDLIRDHLANITEIEEAPADAYLEELEARLEETREIVKLNLEAAQERNKQNYDKKTRPHDI